MIPLEKLSPPANIMQNVQTSDPEMILRLIEKCMAEGRERDAADMFKKITLDEDISGAVALRLGRAAETVGFPDRALHCYKVALADRESERDACVMLARLYCERGDEENAAGYYNRAKQAGISPDLDTAFMHETSLSGCDDDVEMELPESADARKPAARALLNLFRARSDVYACQWYDRRNDRVGYAPMQGPLDEKVVYRHLAGSTTIGVYPLLKDTTVYFAAIDMDMDKKCLASSGNQRLPDELKHVVAEVYTWSRTQNLSVVFEWSGWKGVHAWYLFEKPLQADFVIDLMRSCTASLGPVPETISLEIFPKQSKHSGKGYGNLIKLPLGLHRRTGRKSVFLDQYGTLISDSYAYLDRIRKNNSTRMNELYDMWLRRTYEKKVAPLHGSVDQSSQSELHADAELLSRKCHMLGYLIKKARDHNHLEFQERRILLGVLGHLHEGRQMLHDIISHCSDYSKSITDHYISKLSGTPLGCSRIRRVLFYLEGSIPCDCSFETGEGEYPSPLLHLHQCTSHEGAEAQGQQDIQSQINDLRQEVSRLSKIIENPAFLHGM